MPQAALWPFGESLGRGVRRRCKTVSCKLLGEPMVPDFIALAAVVVVLFSSTYFFMASLPFLLVRLDIPEVSRLLRGLFNVYFWMIGVSGLVATTVFAASGRMAFAAAMLSLAVSSMALGRRVLRSIDRQQTAPAMPQPDGSYV